MANSQITICYLTKKPNAITTLVQSLKQAFPKLTASQTDSAEKLLNFKGLDLIIADPDFRGINAACPVLYILTESEAKDPSKWPTSNFVSEKEIKTYVLARAVKNILETEKLSKELKESSIKDELTGLYNQRFLIETLGIEIKKAIRYNSPLTLLYTGLDNLRSVNSKYGHEVGDRVILDFGLIVANSLRCVDTVGRFNGDEFLAILPETPQSNSLKVCRRILNATQNFAFANGEAGLNVTACIGIATLSTLTRAPNELLSHARLALEGAKKRGQNNVCTFDEAKSIEEPVKENTELINAIKRKIYLLTEESKKSHYSNILKFFEDIPLYRKFLSHSEHVAFYSERLANKMGLGAEELSSIKISALLHDIGKLAIDERIVGKNGPLTGTEYAFIKQHPVLGAQMLSESAFIKGEINTILHHHENFDGSGYPDHMQGTNIPLQSRIVALAEAWDTMITPQIYREAFSLDQALDELKKGAGHQFDPDVVAIFTGLIEN
ncbi:MAG: diguanylate cyclase [Deltaproteobacteria bacterium]|nr:diguanylate cyclase [Deltaproteobacteria bacterium]MBI2974375.1 diguanylate cyclase [Deltaproteobacteria bacterium]